MLAGEGAGCLHKWLTTWQTDNWLVAILSHSRNHTRASLCHIVPAVFRTMNKHSLFVSSIMSIESANGYWRLISERITIRYLTDVSPCPSLSWQNRAAWNKVGYRPRSCRQGQTKVIIVGRIFQADFMITSDTDQSPKLLRSNAVWKFFY